MINKIITIALFMVLPSLAFAQTNDVMDNYYAGTNAGANLEIDSTGERATNNTFIGATAGYSDSTGSANVGLGYGVLRNLTTGRGNVSLGFLAGQDITTENHRLIIGNGYYPDNEITGNFSTGDFIVEGNWRSYLDINKSDSNDTLASTDLGQFNSFRPIAGKRTVTLPSAEAGLYFEFYVADADSLVITVTAGDSILTSAGAAVVTQTSVAGSLKLVAIDAVRWVMVNLVGS
jgi:hypothetical protein